MSATIDLRPLSRSSSVGGVVDAGGAASDAGGSSTSTSGSGSHDSSSSCLSVWTRLMGFADQPHRFNDQMLTMPSTALPCLSRTALFVFRVIILVYFISMFIWDGIYYNWADDMSKNATYLTHWTYAIVNAYFILAVVAMFRATEGQAKPFDFLHQLTLLTFTAALILSCIVVPVYWGALFKGPMAPLGLWFNFVVHASTLLFCLIDLFLSRLILVWRHYIWVLIWGLTNLAFNAWWSLTNSTGLPLYSILSWKSISSFIVIVALLLWALACMALLMVCIAWRDRTAIECCGCCVLACCDAGLRSGRSSEAEIAMTVLSESAPLSPSPSSPALPLSSASTLP